MGEDVLKIDPQLLMSAVEKLTQTQHQNAILKFALAFTNGTNCNTQVDAYPCPHVSYTR